MSSSFANKAIIVLSKTTSSKLLFWISCLGSKKTHASRKARLQKQGISEEQFNRINGPAGLDINAKNPAEIAVSILAELIKDWRGET